MRLFATGKGRLEEIEEIHHKESDIRPTFDRNLSKFFRNVELIKTECRIQDMRIDTLAFDKKAKAFVIIEYKGDQNKGAVEQGMAYLEQLEQHRGDCLQRLMEKRGDGKSVYESDIAWKKTRLIIVGYSFSKHQIKAFASKNQIELYEFRKYPDYLIVSRVGEDNELSTRRSLRPGSRRDDKPPASSDTFDTSVILSVFEDGKTHTLGEVYAAVEESCAPQKLDLVIKKRIRGRIRVLCVKGIMVRVHQSTYRLKSSSRPAAKEPLTRRSPHPRERSDKPSASRASFDSSIIFSVLEDGKTHTLSELYAAVEESCAQKQISTFRIRQRVRARIKALCTKNTVTRVDKSTYRLTSGSGRTDKQQTARVGSTRGYSEADWLDGKDGGPKPTPQVRDLYLSLNRALLVSRHLERVQNKKCASYRLQDGTQVCSISLHKSKLEIVYAISKGDIPLPKDFVHDISDVGHYGKGDYRSYIATTSDASRAMECVVAVQRHLSRSGV